MAAQNQHYVPKSILRNFLADRRGEMVNVFQKSTRTGFTTSIKNIMAERRFHDFVVGDEYLASFEAGMTVVEETILPRYHRILADRTLEGSPEEQGELAFFLAFQHLRTRQSRDQFRQMDDLLDQKLRQMGSSLEQVQGYEPLTEDRLKAEHFRFIRNTTETLAQITAAKDFLLLAPPPGRSFYLSDHPVALFNSEPSNSFYPNIGFAVSGIEIYLPLSADLLLAAWCPSIRGSLSNGAEAIRQSLSSAALYQLRAGAMGAEQMRQQMEALRQNKVVGEDIVDCIYSGVPHRLGPEQMDFYNSLQMSWAREFVVSPDGDFALAEQFMEKNPKSQGRRISMG